MDCRIYLAAVCVLFAFIQVDSQCPKLYQRYHKDHTYCQKKSQSCNRVRSGLTKTERDQIVDEHNKLRKVIANQEKGNRGLPAASDMISIEWDNELARVAQAHSDQCIYEHDENYQRRVQNFPVGQNMALSGPGSRGNADWPKIVKSWFSEISSFKRSQICGPRVLEATGHFTQVIWSETFRVGCGYTQYKEGDSYSELYVCNYGPAGNDDNTCVYEEGSACSKCPVNTACSDGQGLCKRTNTDGPYKKDDTKYLFNCDYRNPNSRDCQVYANGVNKWLTYKVLEGGYLEAVLQPGQNGTLIYANKITPSKGKCIKKVVVKIRKGPDSAKDDEDNLTKLQYIGKRSWSDLWFDHDIKGQAPEYRQDFTTQNSLLNWRYETTMRISFEVPRDATPQFLNIASVRAIEGNC